MSFVSDDQFALPETQLAINILVLSLGVVILFIVAHTVFDLLCYLAFRFKFRQSFVPRSWLFIVGASLWTLLTPARSQAIDISQSVSPIEVKSASQKNQFDKVNSLFTCSVVVAGILLEIGKIRGRQLCKLEAHSRLNHPSAPAILTELSLRATQNSLATDYEKYAQTFLLANSDSPIYVPLGLCDLHLQFVDLGRNSVVSISGSNQTEQLSVLNALIISALFTSSKKSNIMLYSKKPHQSTNNIGISTASSIAELIQSAKTANFHSVVFCREEVSDDEVMQLCDSGLSVICLHPTTKSTTELYLDDLTWRLSSCADSITPFSLSASQVALLGELLSDVVRCGNEPIARQADHANSIVAIENVEDYKVLVRTLGPVEIQLADGTAVEFEKSKTKELLAWLTNHRSRPTRSAARTALWEFTVADATFTNVVSDIRRTLKQTELLSPLEEWIPRTFSDHLPFHQSIVSDGEVLSKCIDNAQNLPLDAAVVELHRGLELVRDLPFAGTDYLWPDAEGITSQLVMTVITAATMSAELDLVRGKVDGVFWATAQGLKVLGAHEELFALRMKAHALQGDLAGVQFEFDSYTRAINSDSYSFSEPSPKLVSLLNQLTNNLIVEKSVSLAR
jgi:two-component SAPR family response regulator